MKPGSVFEVYEPPPGGLARLRARLATPRPRPGWRLGVAVALPLALVVSVSVATWPVSGEEEAVLLLKAWRAAEATGTEPVVVLSPGAAVQRRPSSDPTVVLYRLAALDPLDGPPRTSP